MADLVVIVPSRERPQAAQELAAAFRATVISDAVLVFAVDANDESDYELAVGEPQLAKVERSNTYTMCQALNVCASLVANSDDPPFAIGFMGDDHRPRTHGWDKAYVDALREMGTGIVYGNDLNQGGKLPTQCAMTSDIIRTLGFMAPSSLTHLYVDNFWLSLGLSADCIRYLPDVVVEHMHPAVGKAEWDAGYLRVNNVAMYRLDEAAFGEYARTRFLEDVAKVKALRDG